MKSVRTYSIAYYSPYLFVSCDIDLINRWHNCPIIIDVEFHNDYAVVVVHDYVAILTPYGILTPSRPFKYRESIFARKGGRQVLIHPSR
ncbi:hypothetical protein Pogu_2133 [Pyrobaculum oguniense TE7]|uniref:Uncharacterized protein n=1 Tax=Pyrobaculum oguniense (strain DSM 13380 / JCM 10595 / TE7) TaxID=698757 RepID=H6QCW4_PYROT|nr:hypothetical protein Pogu_2133 [Pyrobaculum oguniense TE7]